MPDIKKIVIQKSDEPAAVVEKLMDTDADSVTLSIPKFSKFAESVSNFKLVKRQAELLKREVTIESVDEDVIALAKKVGIEAVNPFFGRAARGQKQFSDIVAKKPVRSTRVVRQAAPAPAPEPEEPELTPEPEPALQEVAEVAPPTRITGVASLEELPKKKRITGQIFRLRTAVLVLLAIVVFGVVPYVALAVLPKADITLTMQKENWEFKNAVVVDKSITAIDNPSSRIPGQVFMQKSNVSSKFPATGKKNIERKATGVIMIYNAYNSAPQSLVANTRFTSPDGKVFRLVTAVTVPGAKIESGKIVPASVTADVVADKAGDAYNLGPVSKFTIPGFSGTPKYEAFYAESKAAFTGGFIGEAKVATDADIKDAKVKAAQALEASLRTLLTAQMPTDFKVLDNATVFTLAKQTVTPEAGADGQFTILSDGQVSAIAFREKDLLDFLHGRLTTEKGDQFDVLSESKEYGVARVDASAGRMSFAITYTASLRRKLDTVGFLSQVVGKSEDELKAVIAAVPGIQGGNASLWPFYVRTVTKKSDRVKIIVE